MIFQCSLSNNKRMGNILESSDVPVLFLFGQLFPFGEVGIGRCGR